MPTLVVLLCLASAAAPPAVRYDVDGLPLPMHAVARLGRTQIRHDFLIGAVAVSADGRRSATFAHDETEDVRLWDNRTGTLLARLPLEEKRTPTRLMFAENGDLVAYDREGRILVREEATGKVHRSRVAAVREIAAAVAPDGRTAAFDVDDGIVLADTRTGKVQHRLATKGKKGAPNGLTFSPDGKRLAARNDYEGIVVWDLVQRAVIGTVAVSLEQGETLRFADLAFSSDGSAIAVSLDGRVAFFDGRTLAPTRTVFVAAERPRKGIFDPVTKAFVVRSGGGGILKIDPRTGEVATLPLSFAPHEVAFAPGVIACSRDETLYLLDSRTGRFLHGDETRDAPAAVRTANGRLMVIDRQGTVTTYDARTYRILGTVAMDRPRRFLPRVQVSRDGSRILIADRTFYLLTSFDATTGRALWATKDEGVDSPMRVPALSGDGRFVTTALPLGKRREMLDATTGRVLWSKPMAHHRDVFAAWSHDAKRFAVVGEGGALTVHDGATGDV